VWRPTNTVLDWLTARPIAHRGLHDLKQGRVENSLPAFEAAIEHGYPIECDVQLSGDAEAMVFHDDTLDRVTEATGLVSSHTARQLTTIGYKHGKGTIATLPQMLDLVAGKVGLVIEIKSKWDGGTHLAVRVAECLENYQYDAAIMSFDPVPIAWAAECAPHILRGIVADGATHEEYDALPLSARLSLREMRHANVTRPDFLSLDKDWLPCPVSREARAAGTHVICWTIRSQLQASDALRWCDQITFEGYLPKVQ
jgi:glycerophosphoryl diester phosphodiesterase